MPDVQVGTTAVAFNFGAQQRVIIQNNSGAGAVVALGRNSTVTVAGTDAGGDPDSPGTGGLVLADGEAYEWPTDLGESGGGTVYVVSDTAGTDVRFLVVG